MNFKSIDISNSSAVILPQQVLILAGGPYGDQSKHNVVSCRQFYMIGTNYGVNDLFWIGPKLCQKRILKCNYIYIGINLGVMVYTEWTIPGSVRKE
jgi:hypothetical protein